MSSGLHFIRKYPAVPYFNVEIGQGTVSGMKNIFRTRYNS